MINGKRYKKGEKIMKKLNLTAIALVLLVGSTNLMAGETGTINCCEPTPVGGLERLIRNTECPNWARTLKNDAEVILNFHVAADGTVSGIRVAKSGGAFFDKSAVEAVMSTKWEPAMQNGHPVALTFALPFEFRCK
jgi:TonB family protein